jgi:transcriptional regulator with XRE-family HTH domain
MSIIKTIYYDALTALQVGHDMDFKSEYRFAGLSRQQVAETFSVTERTVRNWENKGAPDYAYKYLLLMKGRLDFFGKAWEGFRITPECIESPEGDHVYPGEVRAIKYLYQTANISRLEVCTRLDLHNILKVSMSKHQRPTSLLGLLPSDKLLT